MCWYKVIQFKCMNEARSACSLFFFFFSLLSFKSAFLFLDFEAVGKKILLPNLYTDKVCAFLPISSAFQLAIFSKIVSDFCIFRYPCQIWEWQFSDAVYIPEFHFFSPQNGGAVSTLMQIVLNYIWYYFCGFYWYKLANKLNIQFVSDLPEFTHW